jgi:hypothetical protein
MQNNPAYDVTYGCSQQISKPQVNKNAWHRILADFIYVTQIAAAFGNLINAIARCSTI